MKLIECYIENFGKLSSFTHTFSEGLNIINADNGYGKTTLSVFIKSMLYGIDAKKLRGEESDRKRYMPWQGGRFGGSLTFEDKGNLYRIERTFGGKPSGDIFAIYNAESGALLGDYSENVGEELFGIDADGFERTVFLSEKNLSVNGSNQTVAAKLSDLVGVDGDMGSFDKALEKLEKKEKYYQHRRGKGGIIGDIKSDISRLDSEIIALDAKKAECLATENKISYIKKKLTEAINKSSELEKKKNALEYEKEYLRKKEALFECEKEISEINRFFGGVPPTREEVRIHEKKKNEAAALRHTLASVKNDQKENFEDYSEIIDTHISAIESLKTSDNANKTFHSHLIYAIALAVCSIALGLAIHPLCYLISLASLPFVYLSIASLSKLQKKADEKKKILSSAKLFITKKTGKVTIDEEIYASLCHMKAELIAKKSEIANSSRATLLTEERINALTEEYTAFLCRYSLSGDNAFDEIEHRISSYESLRSLHKRINDDCQKYAFDHNINPEANFSEKSSPVSDSAEAIENETKLLRNELFSLESKLSLLYDEIAKEDELKEKRLELGDSLLSAIESHKTVLKAAEHLSNAKDSLTSKYLGKMRTSFNTYINDMNSEDGKLFTIDTDFSVKKTESGLTNKIEVYSLGTREMYSLISRFSLIDALYSENPPFIILDDPFCHFDDEKCKAALRVTEKIAMGKQIIYFTCSDSRTPC